MLKKTTARIAVIGAGVAGPVLVGNLLNKELNQALLQHHGNNKLQKNDQSKSPFTIDIYERDTPERDQGTGYDLNNTALEALRLAGFESRYMEVTRPNSNHMRLFAHGNPTPLFDLTQPKFTYRWWGPKLETNRQALRDMIVNDLTKEDLCNIHFNCPVEDVRKISTSNDIEDDGDSNHCAELIGANGNSLGIYDLVIDASGVWSPLRKLRIDESPENHNMEWYTGMTLLHGILDNPELSCAPEIVKMLGQGTAIIVGPRGRTIVLQRYGAKPEDHRTVFMYFEQVKEGPYELATQLKIPRHATGQLQGRELATVQEHIIDILNGEWDPMYVDVVKRINSVTIRPIFLQPENPTFRDHGNLPLICIGDALHAVPPWTGMGGNLALHDTIDVAEFVRKQWIQKQDGLQRDFVNFDELRALEQKVMSRLPEVHESSREEMLRIQKQNELLKNVTDVSKYTLGDFGIGPKGYIGVALMSAVQFLMTWDA